MSQINTSRDLEIKTSIQRLIKEWYELKHDNINYPFIPGHTYIPASKNVFNEEELMLLTESCLDFQLTSGRFLKQFEIQLANFLGTDHVITTNSEILSYLHAIDILTSPILENKALKAGDEVITTASFPAAIIPIIQKGLVPVFTDIEIGTYNIDILKLQKSLSSKTRAIIAKHMMGNPANLESLREFSKQNNLFLIEDCSDSLGSKYKENYTGTYSDIAVFCFDQESHITMGKGGAIAINNELKDLLYDYSHKANIENYFKATEMQAAIGAAQLRKLPYFISTRQRNFDLIYDGLQQQEKKLILPDKNEDTSPNWLGFPITVRENAGFTKEQLVKYLESNRIEAKPLFENNITQQLEYRNISFRTNNDLQNTDFIKNNTFWVGLHPGISIDMIKYITSKINEFIINTGCKNAGHT